MVAYTWVWQFFLIVYAIYMTCFKLLLSNNSICLPVLLCLQVPLEDEKRFRIEMTFSRGADLSPLEVIARILHNAGHKFSCVFASL
jgi:hypothetical protein